MRYTQNGKAVASFSIAVPRTPGAPKEQTDFIPIVAWEKLAEICGNNLTKGRRVLVEGRLQIRTYEATNGQKRRIAEVVAQHIEFLDYKQAEHSEPGGDYHGFGSEVFPEEEIPF